MSISCSWTGIKTSLPLVVHPPGVPIDESEDGVHQDSLDELTRPDDNDTHPEFRLSVGGKQCIQEVYIVSVGLRRAEIFAESGEYLGTVSGKTVIPDTDFQIESLKIQGGGRSFLRIKAHLRDLSAKSFFLLGIQVSTSGVSSTMQLSHFDVSQVNRLLQSNSLTENAQDFKGMFEAFQASASIKAPLLSVPLSSGCTCSKDLEKRLMDRIDSMEQRTTEKLDLILRHIMESKT